MGGYNSGGRNQKHDSVERYRRLDSFFYRQLIGLMESKGREFLKLNEFTFYKNYLENADGTLLLTAVPNHYGGADRLYFECPYCYRRVRFLYWHQQWYKCRTCARLNYRSQQATKSNGDFSAYKMPMPLLA